MKLPTYKAEALKGYREQDMWALASGPMVIEFFDGTTLRTTRNRTILSWHFWRLHRDFPGCPIMPSHHIGNGSLKKGFELRIGGKVFWDVYEYLSKPYEDVVWDMSKAMYEIINHIHNTTVGSLSEYVTTVSLEDMVDLMDDPVIADVKQRMQTDEIPFDEGYSLITQELNKDKPAFRQNGIAKMSRANLLSQKQLVQFLGARGYVFATDGSVYREPIYNSYGDGFQTLYDSITESRSASRALYMNDDPLKDSEYLNRQMQLLTAVVRRVEVDNCGTPHRLSWLVSKQDLKSLRGKYHLVNGQDVLFDGDPEWVGKVIQIRSITLCQNEDTGTVCRTCLGQLARVIPPRTNLGHFLTTDPLSALSQLILSTKHVETSQGAMHFSLEGEAGKWFRLDPTNKSSVQVKRTNVANNYILRFSEDEAPGLNSVLYCEDPEALLPQRVSCVSEIEIANADHEGRQKGDWSIFGTMIGGVGSALSSDVLAAIKRGGWRKVGNLVEVKLQGFRYKPLFITPRRSEDMLTFQKTIKHFVFGSDSKEEAMVAHTNCGQAVAALKRLFDEKIQINMVHAEIFVRACMTVDGRANDYRLPKGGDPFVFMPARTIISNRSVSAALAYQSQRQVLTNHKSYLAHERPIHPLDPIIGSTSLVPTVDHI